MAGTQGLGTGVEAAQRRGWRGAARLPRSSGVSEAGGGVGEGTPGPGNSLGCASSSEPQKLSSEKLRKSAWLSEVYTRVRQVEGNL